MIVLLTLLAVTAFLVVISALVFFHELGHYSVARFFGVAVERFSIGFGKPLWRHTAKSGTEWTISAIPLGGYVKFLGDASAASNPDSEELKRIRNDLDSKYGEGTADKCFHFKPLWQRALVVLAGPLANIILAIIILAGLASFIGRPTGDAIVQTVAEDSVAETAGLQPGDHIVSIDGKAVATAGDVSSYVMIRSGEDLIFRVIRDGSEQELLLVPKRTEIEDAIGGKAEVGRIGVTIGQSWEKVPFPRSIIYGTQETGSVIAATGTYVKRIFQGKEDGKQLGGVVRIATMTGKTATDAAQLDASFTQRLKVMSLSLISLAAFLSIGLGVANLMPIPVLDGGHLMLYGYEAVAGRPLSEKGQDIVFRFGVILLLGLFIILTWNDIGYVRSIFS